MPRIIFVPQYPTKMRYQEWWFTHLPLEFIKRGFNVKTLGFDYIMKNKYVDNNPEDFSPINQAIELENIQINEYMKMKIEDEDILFVSDISFPGIFCNALYHKRCPRMFAFCHATSLNYYDYFQYVRDSKFPVETGHSLLFDKIFVGSEYHQNKLQKPDNRYWNNTLVTYLPYPPIFIKTKPLKKTIQIMSASRPTAQKVDLELEKYVESKLKLKIQRPVSNSWQEYYWNLSCSKILLITAHEDTFGYQIVDAIKNGCIPIARNSLAYPEILPRQFLYDTEDELINKIKNISDGNIIIAPKLLCHEQMTQFYNVICDEMKEN